MLTTNVTINFLSDNIFLKTGLECAAKDACKEFDNLNVNVVNIASIPDLTLNILKNNVPMIVLFDSDFLQFYERFMVIKNMNEANLDINSALLCEEAEYKRMNKLYGLLFDSVISKACSFEYIKEELINLITLSTQRQQKVTCPNDVNKLPSAILDLTPRELIVLKNIFKGMNTKDIARNLFISEKSVLSHRSRIYSKFQVHSISELYIYVKKDMQIRYM